VDSPTARDRLRSALGLLRACHPEATVAVTLASALLAVVVGRGPTGTVAAAAALLASQLCVGWHNDWLDAERDALSARRDKPITAGQVSRRTVGIAALVAAPATVGLALLSGWPAAIVATVALAGGLAYNWPLKNTIASPIPYLVSFGALAGFVVLGRPGAPLPPWWLVIAAATLGGGAHFANVLPDLGDDLRTGVRGLPHRLGPAGSWLAASALLGTATAVLVFGPPGRPSWVALGILVVTAVVLPTGWYASRRLGSRAAFRSVLVIALADVILLVLSGARI
jgi:protoheme IX farnesyltransferase